MTPWKTLSDSPFGSCPDPEVAAAVRAGIKELFKRYPVRIEGEYMMSWGDPAGQRDAVEWRRNALDIADAGMALLVADNTGVPQEELISLGMLAGVTLNTAEVKPRQSSSPPRAWSATLRSQRR